MLRSPLLGRRIHIAGSVSLDPMIASTADVEAARAFVQGLSQELIRHGSTFVLSVDAEKCRPDDGLPICFDWLIWQTLYSSSPSRPSHAPDPLAIAVQHYKNEDQVPSEFEALWTNLRNSDLVQIENVSHWSMNSKRMEAQARWGEILITLGGSEGVLFLANLYHDAGKPVVPLKFPITPPDTGSARLFDLGLSSDHAHRLFETRDQKAHTWINRINFARRTPVRERVSSVIELLEALSPPRAFVIRLLDSNHAEYDDVQSFFDNVVQPIVENEFGYRLTVVDGRQAYDFARIDQEVFSKLHRSSVVLADITGMRPNCFLELGYALGRGLPTMLMVKDGNSHPFDIYTFAALRWKPHEPIDAGRRAFREHWAAIRNRPPLVPKLPLIS